MSACRPNIGVREDEPTGPGSSGGAFGPGDTIKSPHATQKIYMDWHESLEPNKISWRKHKVRGYLRRRVGVGVVAR